MIPFFEDREKALQSVLALIRIMIGLMLVFAFFDKLIGLDSPTPQGMGMLDGYSPTKDYLLYNDGWFSWFFNWMGQFYVVTDILVMIGLLGTGICFVLGIGKKPSVLAFSLMTIMFWMSCLPTSDMPILDYHLIYLVAMIAVYYGDGFERWGLEERWKGTWLATNYPIFE